MEKFEVTILGCGSAVPFEKYMTTSQLVNVHDELFMVDCGEGMQTQIWSSKIKVTRLNHIFISHMHGDHFFGLVPFLSSLGLMLNRTTDMHLYLPEKMVNAIESDLQNYCELPYKVIIHSVDTTIKTVLYEDKTMLVESIPLDHRVPCCGFLFKEKPKENVLLPAKCKEYGVPVSAYRDVKAGNDFVREDGTVVPNSLLTSPNSFVPRSYAFCSDTAYLPEMVEQIKNVNLLYHEATFLKSESEQAAANGHSTAEQAAQIAKEANAKQLAIGHYSIRYDDINQLVDEAKATFPNTVACEKGMVFSL